jgi:hypothetical protein
VPSGGAIVVDRPDIAFRAAIKKAVNLALCVMKTTRARPTIGPPEDGLGRVGLAHPLDLERERSSSASSQDTSTKSSEPRAGLGPGPLVSHPRRTSGRVSRLEWRAAAGMLRSNGDGSGSPGLGEIDRPSVPWTTVNAPQCELCDRTIGGSSLTIAPDGVPVPSNPCLVCPLTSKAARRRCCTRAPALVSILPASSARSLRRAAEAWVTGHSQQASLKTWSTWSGLRCLRCEMPQTRVQRLDKSDRDDPEHNPSISAR